MAVVAKQGEPVSADEIAAWCRARLAPIKTPRYVVFTGALPHTPSERVEKFKLKADKALIARGGGCADNGRRNDVGRSNESGSRHNGYHRNPARHRLTCAREKSHRAQRSARVNFTQSKIL